MALLTTTPIPSLFKPVEIKTYEVIILSLVGGYAVAGVMLASSGYYVVGSAMVLASPALGFVTGVVIMDRLSIKGPY